MKTFLLHILFFFLFLTTKAKDFGSLKNYLDSSTIEINSDISISEARVLDTLHYFLEVKYPESLNAELYFITPEESFKNLGCIVDSVVSYSSTVENGIVTENALYCLRVSEIDAKQQIKLPLFFFRDYDSVQLWSPSQELVLKDLVQGSISVQNASSKLKLDSPVYELPWVLNHRLLFLVIATLIIIAVSLVLVFGKRIKTYFLVKRLKKEHQAFVLNFQKANFASVKDIERSLRNWKQYMTSITSDSYSSSTTPEISSFSKDNKLVNSLKAVDYSMYSGRDSEVKLEDSFSYFFEVSEKSFEFKLKEVLEKK